MHTSNEKLSYLLSLSKNGNLEKLMQEHPKGSSVSILEMKIVYMERGPKLTGKKRKSRIKNLKRFCREMYAIGNWVEVQPPQSVATEKKKIPQNPRAVYSYRLP